MSYPGVSYTPRDSADRRGCPRGERPAMRVALLALFAGDSWPG
jgi:hypothetical protein